MPVHSDHHINSPNHGNDARNRLWKRHSQQLFYLGRIIRYSAGHLTRLHRIKIGDFQYR